MFPDNILAAFAAIDLTWLTFALVFIGVDVITGICKGAAKRELSSTAMRQGLWHKLGVIVVLLVAALIDAAATAGLDLGFQAPLFEAACGYVIVMELISIMENVVEINPNIAGSKLIHLFGNVDEKALVAAMPSEYQEDAQEDAQEVE